MNIKLFEALSFGLKSLSTIAIKKNYNKIDLVRKVKGVINMETFHETSMDVYFIRHGQTDYSLKDQKIYQEKL